MSYKDLVKAKAYYKAYCEAHKEEKKAYDKVHSRAYRAAHKEEEKARRRRYQGIDHAAAEVMLDKARWCEICLEEVGPKLCPDHDHTTERLRGVLCRKCNSGIGLLGDTAAGVRAALSYLERAEIDATNLQTA